VERKNDRIRAFYCRLWFGHERVPRDSPVAYFFDLGPAEVIIDCRSPPYMQLRIMARLPSSDQVRLSSLAPIYFAIVVRWKPIDSDPHTLVNSLLMLPTADTLKTEDTVETKPQLILF